MSARARRLAAPWRPVLCQQAGLVAIAVAVAWLASVWLWLGGGAGSGAGGASVWWCMPGMGVGAPAAGSGAIDPAAGLPMWLLMSAAMALPGELPAVQYVATNSLRRSRSSAVAVFLAVYLLMWLACGLPATVVTTALDGLPAGALPADALFAAVLAAAAGYELTPLKRRALDRCHRGAPLPPTGVRRVAGVARFGWINAGGCVASCWPAMLAASIAPVAQPLAIAGFTVAMTYERLTRRPRTARRRIAASYIAIAAVFALVAV